MLYQKKKTMKRSCLLGRDFISNPDIEVNFGDSVTIESKLKAPINDIFQIDSFNDEKSEVKLNLNDTLDWNVQDQIEQIIDEHYVKPVRPSKPETNLELEIIVKPNHQPFSFNPRRLSVSEKTAVEEIINDLMNRKIIRASNSQYCSPIVLVKRKSGKFRMAVDYRELNKITLKDNYPIPHIEDQLDKLREKQYFTRLDLKDAFHQINLAESSSKYTSFVTHLGQFEYTRMPFGIVNGSAFFMRFINAVFRPLLDQKRIMIYLDDIMIATQTIEENLEIFAEVLDLFVN